MEALYLQEMEKEEVCRRFKVDPDYLRVRLHRIKKRCRKACPPPPGGRRSSRQG